MDFFHSPSQRGFLTSRQMIFDISKMAKGKEAAGAFKVGDEVQARCYAQGFRGYWPAVVVQVIPPPKWPVQKAETEAKFVVKWAQGPKLFKVRNE